MWFVYSKFKARKWLKCSYEKRFKVFQAVEKKIAKKLKIRPVRLEINYNDNWNCFGAYTSEAGGAKILLNSMLLEDPRYRFHALETLAHETRHAYQFNLVSKRLRWYEFTAKKWQRNLQGYFSSGADSIMYNNQSVERDAQKYSIKFLKKHSYPGDPDYERTLRIVVDRYERADDDARKEYGLFYKLKIEKNIREKMNNKPKRKKRWFGW